MSSITLYERCARAARVRGGLLAVAMCAVTLAACSSPPPPASPPSTSPPPASAPPPAASVAAPAPAPAPSAAAQPDPRALFVDRTWRVVSSNGVAAGTRYRFESDGTLRIEAEGATPGVGRWTFDQGRLVMIEEGIAYPTDIVALDASRFSIRSHNPGEPVDIAMTKVEDAR
jgi:hypothetical protein